MELSENHDQKQEIESLMLQVKQLEDENQNLYSEIIKLGSKKSKQSLEYYVRLRKGKIKIGRKIIRTRIRKSLRKSKNFRKNVFFKKKIRRT